MVHPLPTLDVRQIEDPNNPGDGFLGRIRRWILEHGEAPTVRETARTTGLSSTASVAYQHQQLEERGETAREAGRRSARIGH
ncbi:LexA family protein [Streptomyces mirabilis]|uniref:LexA family protein n=1 Tax=Streptomyces mirabilis TaxID=68239 RepID=UPI003692B86F